MPWEEIGHCGGDGKAYEREWGTLTRKMGLSYIRFICGEPPIGCRLGLKVFLIDSTKQHMAALFWNLQLIKKAPRSYIWQCQQALAIFDEAVQWRRLRKDRVKPRTYKGLLPKMTSYRLPGSDQAKSL